LKEDLLPINEYFSEHLQLLEEIINSCPVDFVLNASRIDFNFLHCLRKILLVETELFVPSCIVLGNSNELELLIDDLLS